MSYDDPNIDTSTSELGEDYDYLHSLYTKYTTSDDKTLVSKQKEKPSKLEEFLLYFFDWKIVFGVLMTITLFSAIGLNKLYLYFDKINIYSPYGLDMISFFYYGIIINMFIGLSVISFYFNIKKSKGMKGARGKIGEKGIQGENVYCDICNIKPQSLKRNKKLEKTKIVDIPNNLASLEKTTGWTIEKIKNIPNKNHTQIHINNENTQKRFLNGIIVNIDNNYINKIQFIFIDNNNKKYMLPEQNNIGTSIVSNVKSLESPLNSGIYKIIYYTESNTSKLVGIKIYYKNYITGKDVTESNNYIGNIKNTTDIQENSIVIDNKQSNENKYAGLISDIVCDYDTNNIYNIDYTSIIYNSNNTI